MAFNHFFRGLFDRCVALESLELMTNAQVISFPFQPWRAL